MTLSLTQNKRAILPRISAQFLASGGTPPYVYAVATGGAGGSINSSTGVYTAPADVNSDPAKAFDTITVTDGAAAEAEAQIMVTSVLGIVCEIVQSEMGLADDHIYFWDQKIFQPVDSDLYVAVALLRGKPFGSKVQAVSTVSGMDEQKSVNMQATLTFDLISRGPAARDRKEELILAIGSTYAEQQQEQNNFFIGKIPPSAQFINLSEVDGAAIPYRYQISVNIQYAVTKTQAIEFYDQFNASQVVASP